VVNQHVPLQRQPEPLGLSQRAVVIVATEPSVGDKRLILVAYRIEALARDDGSEEREHAPGRQHDPFLRVGMIAMVASLPAGVVSQRPDDADSWVFEERLPQRF